MKTTIVSQILKRVSTIQLHHLISTYKLNESRFIFVYSCAVVINIT